MTASNPPPAETTATVPILELEQLSKHFPVRDGWFGQRRREVRAVDSVSLTVNEGETLGLVGESGCGKSTLGRTLLRLTSPSHGRIHFRGIDITDTTQQALRPLRRRMQIVFQDPYSSLNPRLSVRQIVGEAIQIHRLARNASEEEDKIVGLLQRVGLRPDAIDRFPHEFSGGQRQRIGIARALAVMDGEPTITPTRRWARREFEQAISGQGGLVVCDEPISALDVSIQAQIVNLLEELQEERRLSYLFISHDLKVVSHLARRVAVMYLGRIVELGPTSRMFARRVDGTGSTGNLHPYTTALLSAVPMVDPSKRKVRLLLEGDVPSPLDPPKACAFHPRCRRFVRGTCDVETPLLRELEPGSGHFVACHFPEDT